MAKVYGLKRATPKMKYQHMNMVLAWREELKDKQSRAMTEGTREFFLSQIKRMMGHTEKFHIWFDGVYKFRAQNDMQTYEKKIRNKYYYLLRKERETSEKGQK